MSSNGDGQLNVQVDRKILEPWLRYAKASSTIKERITKLLSEDLPRLQKEISRDLEVRKDLNK